MIPYFEQPVLHLGPLKLYSFGTLVAMAVLFGSRVLVNRAKKQNLDPDIASDFVIWVLVGGFIVGHLFENIVYSYEATLKNPIRLLKIWEGLSSFGGFLGAFLGCVSFIRYKKLANSLSYMDVTCYAFPFGWFFGRMGCFSAHDHPGTFSNFLLAVKFPNGSRHDLGLYEALYTVFICIVFFFTGKTNRPTGFFIMLLVILYSPIRFVLDFLRTVDVRYFGLTPGQYGSAVLFFVGLYMINYIYSKKDRTISETQTN